MEEKDQTEARNGKVCVRFPPSPTGLMHLGTARLALFNYIFSKQHNGRLVFRLDDTDKERSKPEYIQDIIDGLGWLGITYDDGPYYQSQRGPVYAGFLKKLLKDGNAYYCFCSREDLEAQRQYQMSRSEPPVYSGKCSGISLEEAEARLSKGERAVIRFRTKIKKIEFNDIVRGELSFDSALLGDFVIAKDLDNALYNFVSTIDDSVMGITHVIRGEDVLPNTPKQILIQEALGFPIPVYAHLPLILGPDRSKLSKRHGATSVTEYKKMGYLPEAMINFMAFLGWNPGTEEEVYSIQGLIRDFSLEKIQKGGAVFNAKRLDYLNGFYIRRHSAKALAELCVPYLAESGLIALDEDDKNAYEIVATGERIGFDYLEKIAGYLQPRLKKLAEISELADYFFARDLETGIDMLKWKDATAENTKLALDELINLVSKIGEGEWTKEKIEQAILPASESFSKKINKTEWDRGYLLWPMRAALSAKKMSLGPFEIADVLGKQKTLLRFRAAIDSLSL
ncbi:MAG TPA: glutamate--tRNA ligase [Candidatus Paceibacterota bacterium]|nr:glutamate--tRNA ligase [Candidatus Pacearchaeota archaeon]HRZ51258.1 glutamate--tRNA ligase [Candidatus Paceibacterota bacterium]HSA36980.1 glutamate--tRNA ligase [Candidatus Paceibacterota bacterium]